MDKAAPCLGVRFACAKYGAIPGRWLGAENNVPAAQNL